jgi:hypothetical protein
MTDVRYEQAADGKATERQLVMREVNLEIFEIASIRNRK